MTDLPDTDTPLASEDLLQLREQFKQAPIGILRTTVDGRILVANQAFAEMLGYASFHEFSRLTQQNITDLYEDPDSRKELVEIVERQQDSPTHFESCWKRKDNSVFPCRIHVRPSVDKNGKVLYYNGFVEDITYRKSIEKELLAGGERYRSVFENTGAGTIIIEKDTTISLANTGFANLICYSKDEIEGKMKWTAVIAKQDDLNRMLNYHIKRRDSVDKAPIEYEFTLKDRHGNHKDVFLRVDMIVGTDCSVASLIDITSLKSVKRNLRESESRLKGIVEAFDGYIYICTADFQLVYMNNKLKKKTEPKIGHHLGRDRCHLRIFGLDSPCSWCPQKKVFQGATSAIEFQHPGDNRWYYAVSSPIYEEENLVSQTQTVLIDIHERKLSEIALKEREIYLQKENLRLRENIGDRYKFGTIIGKSRAMQHIYELILRAAATDASVIIYGESGTGKELVAREIHKMSDRREHTFLPVNCGAIPGQLMESEFFGYRKGAFTGADLDKRGYFAESDHGTLFLDELGEIDEAMQVKLLRVLEGRGYTPLGGLEPIMPDVRIISATNSNLRPMLENGSMREDFFYRIHIIPINLPPLRERLDDIPLLLEHFMAKHGKGHPTRHLTGHDLDKLMQHDWPGNVRELENTIQRFLNLNVLEFAGPCVTCNVSGKNPKSHSQAPQTRPLRQATRQFEKEHLLQQLEACRWNRTLTAKILGIQRKTLYLKMKQLNLTSPIE
ncbi:sigma 54-interacting transcriptional regulator [Desulforhopalus sp. IMCC35007]|uniref:sigma 54-interacting transcriptional regulator n=1 Tax=Desulforhopalus sp. IMCC35007 TaxID=2569543 RepID=UPI0010AE0332|nr:sigma 54-interacting transcriptional regulator [Desulforhopalus sp. IMCC35007]TKB08538.1 PAS domain S-box protein [Desulforhopalus sp. IMCC35007]